MIAEFAQLTNDIDRFERNETYPNICRPSGTLSTIIVFMNKV
jgi:hypothetical protein